MLAPRSCMENEQEVVAVTVSTSGGGGLDDERMVSAMVRSEYHELCSFLVS